MSEYSPSLQALLEACDKAVIRNGAITRPYRKANRSNSQGIGRIVAEEEGFEPPRPSRA
jgi:hypothetical protein